MSNRRRINWGEAGIEKANRKRLFWKAVALMIFLSAVFISYKAFK